VVCVPEQNLVQGISFVSDIMSICPTRKLMSASCTSQNVLSCAIDTGVEPGTKDFVRQCTHSQPSLPVSVGLLLAMTETFCHVLSIPEKNLLQGISFISGHTLQILYPRCGSAAPKTETCCHVLCIPEKNLLQGISIVSEKSVHLHCQ
jgi:hypothetical protein